MSLLVTAPVERLVALGKLAIEQAGSFEELRELRSKAEALRSYQHAQGAALDAVNAATQLRLRADRRMGEVLAGMEKNAGTRNQLSGSDIVPPPGDAPTYAELGVDNRGCPMPELFPIVPRPDAPDRAVLPSLARLAAC